MARTATFSKKINAVAALKALDGTSYYHKRQLVEAGYLTQVKVPEMKKVPGSRGRDPIAYEITKAGHNLIRLSANWSKPVAG